MVYLKLLLFSRKWGIVREHIRQNYRMQIPPLIAIAHFEGVNKIKI